MRRLLQNTDNWTKLVVYFMWGSPFLGKASAFLGLAIGGLLFLDPRVLLNRWYTALTKHDPLSGFSWALLISLIYGIAEVVYGVLSGNPLITALQILVFNICPLYLFLGVWAGVRRPEIVRRYIRYMAWFAVFYAPLFFLILNKLNQSMPGGSLTQFANPGGGAETLLGLFAFEPNLSPFWLPIAVASFLTIAGQVRAEWLGLGLALIVWGAATRKLGRVFGMAGVITALLLIGFVADIRLPPLPGRGGEISTRGTIARAVAVTSPEKAEDFGSSGNARMYHGTVYWRTHWWQLIRESVSETYPTLAFGLGYGYPLQALDGSGDKGGKSRSPHNIFYFVLGYSGCIGVVLFYWLQFCVLRLLWQTYKETGQIYGFASYSAMLLGAHFGNFLETPQAGIPTYLMAGLCIGPLFRALDSRSVVAEHAIFRPSFSNTAGEESGNTNPTLPLRARPRRGRLSGLSAQLTNVRD